MFVICYFNKAPQKVAIIFWGILGLKRKNCNLDNRCDKKLKKISSKKIFKVDKIMLSGLDGANSVSGKKLGWKDKVLLCLTCTLIEETIA